jgi:Flp pilus assembly pilin Flp
MRNRIWSTVHRTETGASLVEYGLLIAAILVAASVSVTEPVRAIFGL